MERPSTAPSPSGSEKSMTRQERGRQVGRRRFLTRGVSVGTLVTLSGCLAPLRSGRKKRMITRYETGVEAYRTGANRHNEGVIAYRSDEHDAAVDALEAASTELGKAVADFEDAHRLARELDNDRAVQITKGAVTKSRRLLEVTDLLAESAEGFATDDFEQAQSAYDEYKEKRGSVNQGSLATTATLVDAVTGPFGL